MPPSGPRVVVGAVLDALEALEPHFSRGEAWRHHPKGEGPFTRVKRTMGDGSPDGEFEFL